MVKISKTYQDYQEVVEGKSEKELMDFILQAINEHKTSDLFKNASIARSYASGRNLTIMSFQKFLYSLSGKAIPDTFSANHKCASNVYNRFVTQTVAYLLGNGASFQNDDTKAKLGKSFDSVMYKAGKAARIDAVSFIFFNLDHIENYRIDEFVPLFDEENGSLRAGIRYWKLSANKPLRATLFDENGYTEYIKREGEEMEILRKKAPYKLMIKTSVVDGDRIYDGENYPKFPIVPLWGNPEKTSSLCGKREQIDCYDLIKSGFANDVDDASAIYWTISNAGGMDDIDLAKFVERIKTVKAATVDGDEGAKAEAHTIDVPYQARETALQRIENDLYKDFMALNPEQIAAGNVTATQIQAAYEPLNEKTDEFEFCVLEAIDSILELAGVDDEASYVRSQISNQKEQADMIIEAAEYLDSETILKKLPFLTDEEIEGVLMRKDAEEIDRYSSIGEEETVEPIDEESVVENAEQVANKSLNGAQTQSLINIISQYSSGLLSLGQTVNIISVAIGITKEEAKAIIEGSDGEANSGGVEK